MRYVPPRDVDLFTQTARRGYSTSSASSCGMSPGILARLGRVLVRLGRVRESSRVLLFSANVRANAAVEVTVIVVMLC